MRKRREKIINEISEDKCVSLNLKPLIKKYAHFQKLGSRRTVLADTR